MKLATRSSQWGHYQEKLLQKLYLPLYVLKQLRMMMALPAATYGVFL